MNIQKYHCIVLKKIPYGETSLIVNAYSREAGRIAVMAKGALRKGSPLGSLLQPTHLLELLSIEHEGRDLGLLKEADLIDGFSGMHEDYERLLTGTGICEVLLRTQLERQADPLLFDHALHLLQLSASDCPFPGNRLYWFLLFVMAHAGFGLDLARCLECGREASLFAKEEGAVIDRASGALLCPDCAGGTHLSTLSPRLLRVLRFLSNSGLDEPGKREFTRETRRDLGEWLEQQAQYHLEPYRPLVALSTMADL